MLLHSTDGSQVQNGCGCCVGDTATGEPTEDMSQPHARAWWMWGEQGMEEATQPGTWG